MLRIHLLGHMRLFADDQPLKLAARPRASALLAYLLLHRDTIIPRETLAFTLWPDEPEAAARADLRRHLHELQRALPPALAGRPWLLLGGSGVRWNPQADGWLDVAEFERLSADPATLAQAVALYSGELLPGLYDDWVLIERERLSGLYAGALEQLVANCRARRDYQQALEYARLLHQLDPLREDAARTLIALRYQASDRSGALREYQRFEQRLREEIGVAPMPETSALYQAIARNMPLPGDITSLEASASPASGATAGPPPIAAANAPLPAAPPPNNLPAPLASCIGREHELAQLHALIARPDAPVRLLTLTGPGGVGKTRLSLQAAWLWRDSAASFPDGIFFVALSAIDNPDFVAPAIARALGVGETSNRPLLEDLKEFVRHRRLLLILDNFEQVVDAAPLVTDLLQAAPGLRTLVTSRALLQVYGEQEFPVPPLALPDLAQLPPPAGLMAYAAVALFVERARAANLHFELTSENAAVVAEICHRLDGLPLAIELAAARSKLFEPQAMLARLNSRLGFLTSQARNLASRQQTLRATIDWSYNLLSDAGQALFARLAVFVGPFTAEAAEAVASELSIEHEKVKEGDEQRQFFNSQFSILEGLEALANQSMIRQLQSHGPDGEPRFRLLQTLREYAMERLEQRGEAEELRRRHAAFCLSLAQQADAVLTGSQQQAWLARLTTAYDNLRAALDWSLGRNRAEDVEVGLRLAGALWRFWWMQGHLREGRMWLEAALQRCDQAHIGHPLLRAQLLNGAGALARGLADYAAARSLHEAGLEAAQAAGDVRNIATALNGIGNVAVDQGDLATAQARFEESLAYRRASGDVWGSALLLNNLGSVAFSQQQYGRAQELHTESLALMREIGNTRGIASALSGLSMSAFQQGDLGTAQACAEESLALMREIADQRGVASGLINLGHVWHARQEYTIAQAHYTESLTIRREIGDKYGSAIALMFLGCALVNQGDAAAARAHLAESLALMLEIGTTRAIYDALDGLAGAASIGGRPADAVQLFGAAAALRTAVNIPPSPIIQTFILDRYLASARSQLDAAASCTAWEAGQAMTLEQAVAYALNPGAAT